MMFKRIPLIISLLFFLLGTNVFANSHIESSPKHATKKQTVAAEVNKTTNSQDSLSTYIVPSCVTIVLLLGFGSYWLVYRRKHT